MKKPFLSFQFIFTVAVLLLNGGNGICQSYNYYFGNIHAHTKYSDGNQANDTAYNTSAKCYLYGKASLHSNFLGISEHNHLQAGMHLADYHKGSIEADSVNQDGVFSTLHGMEYGVINNGGHVIVYGIDSLIGWEAGNYDIFNSEYDYDGLFRKVNNHASAFAYLAHMQSTDYNNLINQPYNVAWDSAIVGLAMRSGPAFSTDTSYSDPGSSTYNARYQDLLKRGYHVGVGMDQDNHYITFERVNHARTVVLCSTLTRASIMDAYRHRRFYATDDWNANVSFTINSNVMGSNISSTSNPTISVSVTDGDSELCSSIKIWYGVPGSNIAATALTSVTNSNALNYTHSINLNSSYYYYAEITQTDGDKIYTSPIWYSKSGAAVLNLKVFLQGSYVSIGRMRSTLYNLALNADSTVADSIQVNLWLPAHLTNSSPDYSTKTILHTNGNAVTTFPSAVIGNSYYVAVKHRNSLETWSNNPVAFSSNTTYNFSTGLGQAYSDGINPPMKLMGSGIYALYGGNANGDGTIDLSDMSITDNDAQSFFFGYNKTDCTGDGATDASDMALIENNLQLFLYYARP